MPVSKPNVVRLCEQAHRHIDIIEAQYPAAHTAARLEDSDPGLAATRYDREGSSSQVPDPTFGAAVRGTSSKARDMERLLVSVTRDLHRLAADCAAEAPPPRTGDGRIGCGNLLGCPEKKPARREGRCHACWDFHNQHGRDRTFADQAEQLNRQRRGATERKAAARARGVKS